MFACFGGAGSGAVHALINGMKAIAQSRSRHTENGRKNSFIACVICSA